MSKLTRGNVLATIKKLKKMPRPKVSVSAPAVQAICGQRATNKSNKVADLKATVERRRAMLHRDKPVSPTVDVEMFMQQYDKDFAEFCDLLKTTRKSVKTASNDISEPA